MVDRSLEGATIFSAESKAVFSEKYFGGDFLWAKAAGA
jgi:hypothetical protein